MKYSKYELLKIRQEKRIGKIGKKLNHIRTAIDIMKSFTYVNNETKPVNNEYD